MPESRTTPKSRTAAVKEAECKKTTLSLLDDLWGDLGDKVGARLPDGTLTTEF